MIFDGHPVVYSTCRKCHTTMQVISADETDHPCCNPEPDVLDTIATGYLSAVMAGDPEATALTAREYQQRKAKTPPQLHRAAQLYARWGWPVFPLRPLGGKCEGGDKCATVCQCPKAPATKNGFMDATTDLAKIDMWWGRKDYNIGIATGRSFDVFDVDVPEGIAPLRSMLRQKRVPQTHGLVVTASGGVHFYLLPTGKPNSAKFKPGLDFRGRGGYVVVPPSTLGEQSWQWLTLPSPEIKGGQGK